MQKNRINKKKNIHAPSLIFIIFTILAFISVIGLDYIGWRKGQKSYLFATFSEKKQVTPVQDTLEQTILKKLFFHGIPSESVQKYRDNKGFIHLMVDLSLTKYSQLEPELQKELQKRNASIVHKEEQESEDKNYYLWHVDGDEEQNLIILFSCYKKEISQRVFPTEIAKNKVAIIIDDMGYSLKAIRDLSSLNRPLTVSILPFTPLAQETARIAHQNGLEVMLHMPLESVSPEEDNEIEGLIHSRMSEEEIIQAVQTNLDHLPYIKGVNNHMGSKITANKELMGIILEQLKKRNLFFVDSLTTNRSIAYQAAQELGIPSASRQVFLDGETDEEYIKGKLIELFRLAQKKGKAIGICHPHEQTLRVLKENFYLTEKFNLETVFVSQLVQRIQ